MLDDFGNLNKIKIVRMQINQRNFTATKPTAVPLKHNENSGKLFVGFVLECTYLISYHLCLWKLTLKKDAGSRYTLY